MGGSDEPPNVVRARRIRKRAEEDLIGFTDPNALPILKKALSDESNLVQKNAEIALSYFEG